MVKSSDSDADVCVYVGCCDDTCSDCDLDDCNDCDDWDDGDGDDWEDRESADPILDSMDLFLEADDADDATDVVLTQGSLADFLRKWPKRFFAFLWSGV